MSGQQYARPAPVGGSLFNATTLVCGGRMFVRGEVEMRTSYSGVPHSRTVTELPPPEASITRPVA